MAASISTEPTPITHERLEELHMATIRGCSQLEDRIDDLERRLEEADRRIKEHEGRLNDLYLWLAAVADDLLERTVCQDVVHSVA
jgi:uncharacterized membrane-anchored protein